jgi:hypothetical protein
VDYTKSNTYKGERTFGGRCLHEIVYDRENPYQAVIRIVGKTLEPFDDDRLIPAFGFGDASTGGWGCFPFLPDRPCQGLGEVLARYSALTPHLVLSGPTNFAPVINEAIKIVEQSGNQYHILIIIADGEVVSEQETEEAIVRASNFPLSIVVVGVGDGPFDTMEMYDDELPARKFDNVSPPAHTEAPIELC